MTPKVSDAGHWMKCHGSAKAQAQFPALPGEINESRLEGRACHEVAQAILTAFRDGDEMPNLVGTTSRDGVLITEDLHDAAKVYTDDVIQYCVKTMRGDDLHIEERIDLSHIIPEWYGIPDAWMWNPSTKLLKIWDAKFGHQLVDAFENWSMMLYASGILKQIGLSEHDLQFIDINVTIVQPRGFHSDGPVREWQFGHLGKFSRYMAQITEALSDVLSGSPSCTVGPHCGQCTARAHCDVLKTCGYDGMDFTDALSTHDLHGHNLGVELRILRRYKAAIEARLSGLEEQAIHEIKAGHTVTFFGVKQGYGRERWKKETPHAEVIMMGDLMGVDLRKPVELDTPSQARKKGIDESVIAAYTETPVTKMNLVEVSNTTARMVFGK